MKHRILNAALLAAFSLGLAGCGQTPGGSSTAPIKQPSPDGTVKLTFALDWTPNTNHTGVYVARDLGYYAEEGLEVTIVQAPEGDSAGLVGAGRAEFGVGFQESISNALLADEPLPITAVAAIIDHNTSGLISAKDKGIDSFAKLAGHSYATWDSPLEQAVMRQVMKDAGSDFSQLELIPSTVTDAVSAIQTNVDCVWVYEAWDAMAAKVQGVKYNYLRFRDLNPVLDYYTPVIIGNNMCLKDTPEIAKKFMAATAKGYEYAIAHPDEAAELLCKAEPALSKDLVLESQRFLASEYKAEKEKWGFIDEGRWKAFYDWCYEQELIKEPIGARGFTNEFLPE